LEKLDRASALVVAPTAKVPLALAGEKLQALLAEFPDAPTTTTPIARNRLIAALNASYVAAPSDIETTMGWLGEASF